MLRGSTDSEIVKRAQRSPFSSLSTESAKMDTAARHVVANAERSPSDSTSVWLKAMDTKCSVRNTQATKENSVGNGQHLLCTHISGFGQGSTSEPRDSTIEGRRWNCCKSELLVRIICWSHPPDYKTQAHCALLASKDESFKYATLVSLSSPCDASRYSDHNRSQRSLPPC